MQKPVTFFSLLLFSSLLSAYTLHVTAVPSTVPADGVSLAQISARLAMDNGTPVPSVWLFYSSSLGTVNPQYGQTNASGIALFTVSSSISGTAMVIANNTQYGVMAWAWVNFTPLATPTPANPPTPTPSPIPEVDLVVDVSPATGSANVGEIYSFGLGAQNVGNQPSGPFQLEWVLDGQTTSYSSSSLQAGGFFLRSVNVTCTRAGTFTYTWTADVAHVVNEYDESNNVFSGQLNCLSGTPSPSFIPNDTVTPTPSVTLTPTPTVTITPSPSSNETITPSPSTTPVPSVDSIPSPSFSGQNPTPSQLPSQLPPLPPDISPTATDVASDSAPTPFPDVVLSGVVVSSSGSLVSNAKISFFNKQLGLATELTTDQAGAFAAVVPSGDYTVQVNSSQGTRTLSIKVLREQSGPVRIVLEAQLQPDVSKGVDYYGLALFFAALFLLLSAVVGAFRLLKAAADKGTVHPHARPSDVSKAATPGELLQARAKEVLPTLNPRERAVVEYLLAHGEKKRLGKVRFETKIPKTSFFRVIDSLSRKNILRVENFQNTAELHFTDWFKGLR